MRISGLHIIRSFIIALVFLGGIAFSPAEREMKVHVTENSEVVISGTTNIHSFNCHYNLKELESPIRVSYEQKDHKILFRNARLQLTNECFDCGGRGINNDFKELLKTESYPQVELKLLYVESPDQENQRIRAGMEITIAGVTRNYETYLNYEKDRTVCVNGTLGICLSDFGLEPPRKALGMIKVDNEITVRLNLRIREL